MYQLNWLLQYWQSCHDMTCYAFHAVAYRQSLVQQVARSMRTAAERNTADQENVSPNAAASMSCQDAELQLVPPTPVGTAPMQAAAVSVAARRGVARHSGQSALDTMQGTPYCKTMHNA